MDISASRISGFKCDSVTQINGALVCFAKSVKYGTFDLFDFGKSPLIFTYIAPCLSGLRFFFTYCGFFFVMLAVGIEESVAEAFEDAVVSEVAGSASGSSAAVHSSVPDIHPHHSHCQWEALGLAGS